MTDKIFYLFFMRKKLLDFLFSLSTTLFKYIFSPCYSIRIIELFFRFYFIATKKKKPQCHVTIFLKDESLSHLYKYKFKTEIFHVSIHLNIFKSALNRSFEIKNQTMHFVALLELLILASSSTLWATANIIQLQKREIGGSLSLPPFSAIDKNLYSSLDSHDYSGKLDHDYDYNYWYDDVGNGEHNGHHNGVDHVSVIMKNILILKSI